MLQCITRTFFPHILTNLLLLFYLINGLQLLVRKINFVFTFNSKKKTLLSIGWATIYNNYRWSWRFGWWWYMSLHFKWLSSARTLVVCSLLWLMGTLVTPSIIVDYTSLVMTSGSLLRFQWRPHWGGGGAFGPDALPLPAIWYGAPSLLYSAPPPPLSPHRVTKLRLSALLSRLSPPSIMWWIMSIHWDTGQRPFRT